MERHRDKRRQKKRENGKIKVIPSEFGIFVDT
jgi:hypothetical protein